MIYIYVYIYIYYRYIIYVLDISHYILYISICIICFTLFNIYIYIYILQMGTLRGYSINNPRMISKGLLANATLAQDPKQAAKVCVPLPCFETLENCHAVH